MTARRAALAVGAALLAVPAQAQAHARLQRTLPADGAHLQGEPRSVAFYFGEAIEANFGAIRVFDNHGDEVESGAPFRPEGSAQGLAIALKPGAPDGTYTATFRIISADSHPVAGAISFSVGNPSAAGAAAHVAPPRELTSGRATSTAFWADRWLGYAALALALGVPLFMIVAWWPALAAEAGGGDDWLRASAAFNRRAGLLAGGAVAAGTLASLLALPLEAADAGGTTLWSTLNSTTLNEVLDTRFGTLMAVRAGAWALLGVLFVAIASRGRVAALRPARLGATGTALRRPSSPPELLALAMLPVGSLLISPALAGHARTQSPGWLLLPADVLHVTAMCAWLGGLVALAVALPVALAPLAGEARTRLAWGALSRFSPVALAAVIVLAASGTLQAAFEVGSVPALWETGYGRAVVAKVALLVVLIGLGAANRQRLIPALEQAVAAGVEPGRASAWLRRNVRVEVATIALVLGVTAVLVAYAPASERDSQSAAMRAEMNGAPVAGSAPVGPVLLRYTVDPGIVGRNQINLFVRNPQGGASGAAKEVRVELGLPSRGIRPQKPPVEDLGAGHYVVSGAELGLAGTWTVAVTVRTSEFDEATTKFEVPVG